MQTSKSGLHLLFTANIQTELLSNPVSRIRRRVPRRPRGDFRVERCLKHWCLPEFRRSMHQTRPQALFSPPSFLLREKRWGRRRRVRTGLGGTSPRCSRSLFSSEPVSSFPNRKLNLRFGFYRKFDTTSQSRLRRASSPGRGAKGAHRQRCQGNGRQPLSQPAADSSPGRGAKNRRCGAAAEKGHCSALAFTNP